jgi:RND family efflux transporter MFP subunit
MDVLTEPKSGTGAHLGAKFVWILLATLPILSSGCGKKVAAKAIVEIRQVEVTNPVRANITRLIEQPGFLRPYEETPIYTKIAGYVDQVNVDIGDHVTKNSALAKLWVPEMVQTLHVKEAMIKQAEADVNQSKEAANSAKAFVVAAKARIQEAIAGVNRSKADVERWQLEYDRGRKLSTSGVYDRQTLEETQSQLRSTQAIEEEARAKLETARANFEQSSAQFHKAEADIESASARLLVAKADFNQWKDWLAYSEIRAPFDGIITLRNVHTGHFLQPSASGSSIATAHPLFTMMRTDIMRLAVQIPEKDAVLVKEGDPALIRFQALPGKEFTDKITRFSWSLDEHSRTLTAEIHLKNTKNELRPGMYANVTISAILPDAMKLPPEAVLTDGDISYCFRVENGKARKTILRLGVQTADAVQVLQMLSEEPKPNLPIKWETVTGKEQIVTSNPGSLVDGQNVEVKIAKQ